MSPSLPPFLVHLITCDVNMLIHPPQPSHQFTHLFKFVSQKLWPPFLFTCRAALFRLFLLILTSNFLACAFVMTWLFSLLRINEKLFVTSSLLPVTSHSFLTMKVPNPSTPSSSNASSSSSWLPGDCMGEEGGSEFNGGSFFLLLLLDTELVFCLFCEFLLTL